MVPFMPLLISRATSRSRYLNKNYQPCRHLSSFRRDRAQHPATTCQPTSVLAACHHTIPASFAGFSKVRTQLLCSVSERPFPIDDIRSPQQRIGCVKQIKFQNEVSNWCVAEIFLVNTLTQSGGRVFVATGEMPDLKKGGRYNFYGAWESHPKYGKQFAVKKIEQSVPAEVELECLKLFISKTVLYIGPKLAARFVDHFGKEATKILLGSTSSSIDLGSIEGVSASKAQKIVTDCHNMSKSLTLFLQLCPLGISCSRCFWLDAYLGQGLHGRDRRVIESDPYKLVDVPELGFHDVDTIALNNPRFDPEHPKRISAGALHVLKEEGRRNGHTAVEPRVVFRETAKLLGLSEDQVESKIRDGGLSQLEFFVSSGRSFLQAKHLADDERTIATYYRKKQNRRKQHILKPDDLKRAAKQCGFGEFEPSQKEAINAVSEYGTCVITGGPGCGKSAIIPALLSTMPTKNIRIFAPTGKAAQRINASLDSIRTNALERLEMPPFTGAASAITIDLALLWKINPACKLVIVDEASMVHTALLAKLICMLPADCDLVLVGDTDQLPSISPGQVLHDIIQSDVVPVMILKQVFRQESRSPIRALAQHVNQGKFERPFVDALLAKGSSFQFVEIAQDEDVAPVLEDIISGLGESVGSMDLQILAPMKTGIHGVETMNNHFHALNKERRELDGVNFKVGDKVLQTKNRYDVGICNGMMGLVKATTRVISPGGKLLEGLNVQFDELEDEIAMNDSNWEALKLGYAFTIHKSQGSEYPVVIVVLTMKHEYMFQRKLLYTAVTRPKEKLIIVGSYEACKRAAENDKSQHRRTLLKERLMSAP